MSREAYNYKRTAIKTAKAKQKLLGVAAIGVSIASPLLLDGDATISVIMLPLGIYMIFTEEKVIM